MIAAALLAVLATAVAPARMPLPQDPHPRSLVNFENLDDMPAWRKAQWYAKDRSFAAVAPWIGLIKANKETAPAVRAAGIYAYDYADPNLCSGKAARGAILAGYENPYAFPDCSAVGDLAAFYAAPGAAASAATVLATAQRCPSCNANGAYQQLFADPGAPAFAHAWAEQIDARYGARGPFDLLQIDDAAPPPDTVYKGLCWGWLRPAKRDACVVPARDAHDPWGATYALATWLRGEVELGDAPLARGVPVFYNGMGPGGANEAAHLAPAAQAALDSDAALGAMCENCMGGTNANLLSDNGGLIGITGATPLYDLLNAAIRFTNHEPRKTVLYLMRDGGDARTGVDLLAQDYARIMLALTPQNLYYRGPCRNASQIDACIESALTWSDPYVAAGDLRSPYDLLADQTAGKHVGVYYREYRHCAYLGNDVGPCAAVAANDVHRGTPHALPLERLHNAYSGALAIHYIAQPGFPHGGSLCGCFGDTPSTLTFDAPLPRALSAIDAGASPAPVMAAVLFTAHANDVARTVNAARGGG